MHAAKLTLFLVFKYATRCDTATVFFCSIFVTEPVPATAQE